MTKDELTIESLLDLSKTLAAGIFEGLTYPWEALPKIKDYILSLGPTLDKNEYDQIGEDIWVAKSAKVAPTASLNGPLIICPGAEVRHCAFIRGSAFVGCNCVIGNSTELKNCIIFEGAQVPHYNYIGDAILGYKSHLGAGDNVEVGCNSVLNPGTVIGRGTNVYPLSMVRGAVPPGSIYKKQGEVVQKR